MTQVDVSKLDDDAAVALWVLTGGQNRTLVVADIAQYSRLVSDMLHPLPYFIMLKDSTGAGTRIYTIDTTETTSS